MKQKKTFVVILSVKGQEEVCSHHWRDNAIMDTDKVTFENTAAH